MNPAEQEQEESKTFASGEYEELFWYLSLWVMCVYLPTRVQMCVGVSMCV